MRRPFLFLFLFVPLLAACRSGATDENEGVTNTKVVLSSNRDEPEGDPKQPPEWFEEQLDAAHRERKQGRIRDALERIHAAKQENPGRRHLIEFNALLHQLNQDVLELQTIEAWVEVEKDPITIGEPLRLRIHLRNGGKRGIRIPARAKGASDSLFLLNVLRRDYDVRAQISSRRTIVKKPLPQDFEIGPGGSADQVVIIEAALVDNEKGLDGFRTFEIGGRLRPVVVEVGGMRRWEAIPIRPAKLRSFRANWQQLAKEPLEKVALAIGREWGVHLLTASALLPLQQRQAAVDLMVDQLRGDRRIDWAMFAALQHLTNVNLGRDAGAWRAWWPRVRENYFDIPESKPKGVPDFGTAPGK